MESVNKVYEFIAKIKKVPDIDGAYIEFPYDIREEFGKGRVKVRATFDGVIYDGSIVNKGIGRKKVNISGDEVRVTVGER